MEKKFLWKIIFAIALSGLISVVIMVAFIHYSTQSRAGSDRISTVFYPRTLSVGEGKTKSIVLRLQPLQSGSKITAFHIDFNLTGDIEITSVGEPVSITGGKRLKSETIRSSNKGLSVVYLESADNLPYIVDIPLTVKGNKAGSATVGYDRGTSQMTGNINMYSYEIAQNTVLPIRVEAQSDIQLSPTRKIISSVHIEKTYKKNNLQKKYRIQKVENKNIFDAIAKKIQNMYDFVNVKIYSILRLQEE